MHVLLVDDHVMFRQGLKFLLFDLNEKLRFSEAGSGEQALALLGEHDIELVLLDLHMPGSNGLAALRQIREGFPSVPLAVLSGEDDPAVILEAIEEGASGFVPKSSTSELLVAALKLILAGGVYLPANAISSAASITTPVSPEPLKERVNLLSGRQQMILLRAIQGQPNKIIAQDLEIAEGTVKTHLSAAYKALGVHNRTEAVYAAAKIGLKPAPADAD